MADPLVLRRRARHMRAEPTSTEARLWALLRRGQLGGLKFRRQVPIGDYIADFACFTPKLVVEADGGAHRNPEYDARRDAWFESEGFRVLRFRNDEALGDAAAEAILKAAGLVA
ncbi:endonuclease domain-containing protein [Caulobacter sp. 17J65-9]|uniref:endonuclease domain-containing protein n=1 Tax=Caulobacter sp. 17J65-9 TaxID=2709382 RepID=UPI0013C59096|nr:endonuclease domain-containing protein [Caulobacter sp. 17J65-9]NEX93646.1 endonuclease domain-containing protein [Caulobacter sp. 17J65-9]